MWGIGYLQWRISDEMLCHEMCFCQQNGFYMFALYQGCMIDPSRKACMIDDGIIDQLHNLTVHTFTTTPSK
ncbi:unnamed protein product [Miscanthus lutarioriparius]|uniref:Uncharacterized protein n=1 Tax=Miscanthus lutarioriparius TaxID=422564 RepID=A0A811MVQ6_9POAL|nr:unnamed protein product [Miscanthus lutarioriparius]